MKTKWISLLGLALAVAFVAAACGEKEKFTAEPTGTIAFTTGRDYGPGREEDRAGPGTCGDNIDNGGDTLKDAKDEECANVEIYLMNGDGSTQVNISNNEAWDSEASWSPDGSRLAFGSYRTGPLNIFAMNAEGSDVQQLTESPAVEGGARWSPDGSRIAFYSFRAEVAGFMWVMNADGSDPKPILKDLVPSPETACSGGFPGGWFPDSQRILYRGSQGSTGALQICSVAPDGSDVKVIRSETGTMSYYPALSPDSRKIAFTSTRDGNAEIYVMNADGGGLRRLTNDPSLDEYPTWSPDGQWIAFHSDRDGDLDIYIARPDGSDVRQLTDNDDIDMEPSWSPR